MTHAHPSAPASEDAIHTLRALTEQFRASLKPWKDREGKQKTVLVDGVATPLLEADAMAVRNYAYAYTRIWVEQPEMMKREMQRLWFIDCRALHIEASGYSGSKYRQWAPVRFDHSVIDASRQTTGT